MTLELWLIAAVGAAGAANVKRLLSAYNPTRTGLPNHFNIEGAFNVLRLSPYVDRAIAAVRGKLNSMWRSAAVNKAVGGVQPSPQSPRGSRHMRGLACDVAPGVSLDEAMRILYGLALAGRLGPVRQLIKETAKGVVHISFCAIGETVPLRPQLLEQPTREPDYVPYRLEAA